MQSLVADRPTYTRIGTRTCRSRTRSIEHCRRWASQSSNQWMSKSSLTLCLQGKGTASPRPRTACRHQRWSRGSGSRRLALTGCASPRDQVDDHSCARSRSLQYDRAHPSRQPGCSSLLGGPAPLERASPASRPILAASCLGWL